MEANNHVFASTPHKCDEPSKTGHYSNCDRQGCGQNSQSLGRGSYGPGSGYHIDTKRPFEVLTSFYGSGAEAAEAEAAAPSSVHFTGMTTMLRQGSRELVMDHPNCGNYLAGLASAMAKGMAMRITYWGHDPSSMRWLDQPPCGNETCSGINAGPAVISNMTVSETLLPSGHLSPQKYALPENMPTPVPTPEATDLSFEQPSVPDPSQARLGRGSGVDPLTWSKKKLSRVDVPSSHAQGLALGEVEEPEAEAPKGTPWWVVVFVWVSIVQSCMLCALGAFTYRLHQRVAGPSRNAGSPRRPLATSSPSRERALLRSPTQRTPRNERTRSAMWIGEDNSSPVSTVRANSEV